MRLRGWLSRAGEARALEIAHIRQGENIEAGRIDRRPTPDPLGIHIDGARAEAFVAEVYGVEWEPQQWDDRHRPDVAGVDVRATRWVRPNRAAPGPALRLRRDDVDLRPFALVSIREDELRVEGWAFGVDGKVPRYWRTDLGRPYCWLIPHLDLAPAETLPIGDSLPEWCR
jgi:hypothetical protein